MPLVTPRKVQTESHKVRRLIAEYLKNRRVKKRYLARIDAIQKQIKQSLEYLDRNAVHVGDAKAVVAKVLGPAPGSAGPDSWIYPGGTDLESYRVDFQGDAVSGKTFVDYYVS